MPKQSRAAAFTPAAPALPTEDSLTVIKDRGLALVSPLKLRVMQVVVNTDEDYQEADAILADIRLSRESMLEETDINKIITPISEALQKLYKLRVFLLAPFDEFEESVVGKMRTFKAEERRLLQAAQQERRQAEEKALQEQREKEAAALRAKTKPLAIKLMNESVQAGARAQQIADQPKTVAVKAETSVAKFPKQWRLTDLQLLVSAVANGEAPVELLQVDSKAMTAYFRKEKPELGSWLDGVEVYEDVQIAKRPGR